VLALLAGGGALSACEDDAAPTPTANAAEDAGPERGEDAAVSSDAAADGSQTAAPSEPAIVLAERVFSPEGRMYYVSVLSEMPSGPVDRSQAREFMSADIELYAGKLYVRDRFSNTLTRFSVSEDRKLVEEQTLSLQNTGLKDIRFYSVYLSPTQAFIVSDEQDARLIEWNPSTMELTGKEISLDFVLKPGVSTSVSAPIRLGDKLIMNVAWQDYENLIMYPGTGALVVEPSNPEDAHLIEDPRVGAGYVSYTGAQGDAFLVGVVGGDYTLFGKTTDESPMPASGVLRVAREDGEFDREYLADVTAITKSPGIWAIHRIDERTLLVQMWDPETETDKLESADDFNNAEEFIYALVDTEDKTWTHLDAIARGGAGNSLDHVVDDRLYVQSYSGDSATIYAVTPKGIEETFSVPGGDLWFLQRLR
jgi:hypothetical protein